MHDSMRNIKLTIQYDGTDYAGWQRQPLHQGRTIQREIEEALSDVFRERIVITGAGRTDSGVHALGQVANFYCHTPVPTDKIVQVVNCKLPLDIRLTSAKEVPLSFHARYQAHHKRYRYVIEQETYPTVFAHRYVWQKDCRLDVEAMQRGAQYLLGEHDFRNYTVSGVSTDNFVRTMYDLQVYEPSDTAAAFPWQQLRSPLVIEACANGFLYKMVRLIVCRLVAVGERIIAPEDICGYLNGSFDLNLQMAPAKGLMMLRVDY